MKLNERISTTQFIIFSFSILSIGLVFLGALYYLLNVQHQPPSNPFINGPVTTAPKSLILNLDQPDDDLLTFQSSIIVSGKTAPNASVLISTDTDDTVIQSKPDGSFTTILNLEEGVNKITTVVFDATGDFRSASRTVYYSKEKL